MAIGSDKSQINADITSVVSSEIISACLAPFFYPVELPGAYILTGIGSKSSLNGVAGKIDEKMMDAILDLANDEDLMSLLLD